MARTRPRPTPPSKSPKNGKRGLKPLDLILSPHKLFDSPTRSSERIDKRDTSTCKLVKKKKLLANDATSWIKNNDLVKEHKEELFTKRRQRRVRPKEVQSRRKPSTKEHAYALRFPHENPIGVSVRVEEERQETTTIERQRCDNNAAVPPEDFTQMRPLINNQDIEEVFSRVVSPIPLRSPAQQRQNTFLTSYFNVTKYPSDQSSSSSKKTGSQLSQAAHNLLNNFISGNVSDEEDQNTEMEQLSGATVLEPDSPIDLYGLSVLQRREVAKKRMKEKARRLKRLGR